MRKRVIFAIIFAACLGITMVFCQGLALYAIGIWRHEVWTPVIGTLCSAPYWMVFGPLLYCAKPGGILASAAAGWICGIIMCLFWGFLATYVLDVVKRLRRRTIIAGVTVLLVILAIVSLRAVRWSNRTSVPRDMQAQKSQMRLETLASVIKTYHEQYSHYPQTINQLNAGFPENEYPFTLLDPIDNGLFIWQKYVYRVNKERTEYTIFSKGLDGRKGTADDLYPSGSITPPPFSTATER